MEYLKSFPLRIVFLCLILCQASCTALFFQPIKEHVLSPSDYDIKFQDVFFDSVDNLQLHGWWFTAEAPSKGVIVFLQGNSGNISTQAASAYWLTQHSYDVFVFDYRGYGYSEGVAFLEGVLSDIEQAIHYARLHSGDTKKVFVLGHSLGASMGVVAVSEAKESVDGAIFVSPFNGYREITREFLSKYWMTWLFQWPLSFTVNDDYRPLDFVGEITPVPTLFLYSDVDEVVPSSQTRALYEKANQPKNIEEVVGSHNAIMGIQKNRDIILKYLESWSEQYLAE